MRHVFSSVGVIRASERTKGEVLPRRKDGEMTPEIDGGSERDRGFKPEERFTSTGLETLAIDGWFYQEGD